MFFLYILYSQSKDRFYIGSTGNLSDRINRHNSGRSKATKAGRPWKLMYVEEFNSRADAMKREFFIKNKKSREFIIKLIDNHPK